MLLFPILLEPHSAAGGDIQLDLAELIAAGIALPAGTLRVAAPQVRSPSELRAVGQLQGRTVCRLVVAVAKAFDHAACEARHRDGARHRRHHAERLPVNMAG